MQPLDRVKVMGVKVDQRRVVVALLPWRSVLGAKSPSTSLFSAAAAAVIAAVESPYQRRSGKRFRQIECRGRQREGEREKEGESALEIGTGD